MLRCCLSFLKLITKLSFIEPPKASRLIPIRANSFLLCCTACAIYWDLVLLLNLEHCHKVVPQALFLFVCFTVYLCAIAKIQQPCIFN